MIAMSNLPVNDPALSERLALIAEEAAEVIQVVGKTLRHGLDSYSPLDPLQYDNVERLEQEIGDFLCAVEKMVNSEEGLSIRRINAAIARKRENGKKYLHYQDNEVQTYYLTLELVEANAFVS